MKTFVKKHPRCVQNEGRIKNCKRKDLEEALSLLLSRNNKTRKNLIEKLNLAPKEKERLLKIVSIKKSEHSFLFALFQKISWKDAMISFDKNEVYPDLSTLEKDSDLSPSALSTAKRSLKEKGLLTWQNRYKKSSSKESMRSTSNRYEMRTRIFDLALFTEFAFQRQRTKKETKQIKSLALKLLAPIKTEKTLYQKSGQMGHLKKKKNETNLKTLEKKPAPKNKKIILKSLRTS